MSKATRIGRLLMAALLGGATLLGMQAAWAHDAHHHAGPADAKPKAARVTLHDNQLVDLDRNPVRFTSEAVGNSIVVIDFIYTSCTTICPVTSAVFADVQKRLIDKFGEQFGRDVKLITLTVDPSTDTPERLKDYAGHFGSPAGWLWLTGDKPQVDKVLSGLGAYAADFTRHSGAVLVGDGRADDWIRFYGVPNPPDIVARVEQLVAARQPASLTAGDEAGVIGRR
jgi:protein SCO1/2